MNYTIELTPSMLRLFWEYAEIYLIADTRLRDFNENKRWRNVVLSENVEAMDTIKANGIDLFNLGVTDRYPAYVLVGIANSEPELLSEIIQDMIESFIKHLSCASFPIKADLGDINGDLYRMTNTNSESFEIEFKGHYDTEGDPLIKISSEASSNLISSNLDKLKDFEKLQGIIPHESEGKVERHMVISRSFRNNIIQNLMGMKCNPEITLDHGINVRSLNILYGRSERVYTIDTGREEPIRLPVKGRKGIVMGINTTPIIFDEFFGGDEMNVLPASKLEEIQENPNPNRAQRRAKSDAAYEERREYQVKNRFMKSTKHSNNKSKRRKV